MIKKGILNHMNLYIIAIFDTKIKKQKQNSNIFKRKKIQQIFFVSKYNNKNILY